MRNSTASWHGARGSFDHHLIYGREGAPTLPPTLGKLFIAFFLISFILGIALTSQTLQEDTSTPLSLLFIPAAAPGCSSRHIRSEAVPGMNHCLSILSPEEKGMESTGRSLADLLGTVHSV